MFENDILNAVVTNLSTVLIALGTVWIKTSLDQKAREKAKRDVDPVKQQIHHSKHVDSMLESLLVQYDCDRVNIIQFKNGDYYYSESPIQKMQETYMKRKPGSPDEPFFRNIDSSLNSRNRFYIEQVTESILAFRYVDEIPDLSFKTIIKSLGMESIVSFPIYKDKKLVAILNVMWKNTAPEFCDIQSKESEEIYKEAYNQIKSIAEHL